MYVSALGTIADIYYSQGQTDKALAYMEPFLSGETTALRNLFRLSKADERLAFWKDIRSSLRKRRNGRTGYRRQCCGERHYHRNNYRF